tara:strand:- start:467 stop:667 length:201 start_codon:yes stop_codon:yes gene_type:complete
MGRLNMPKYIVQWTKGYYKSGVVQIEALDSDEAHDLVRDNVRKDMYDAELQYDEHGTDIDILKEVR